MRKDTSFSNEKLSADEFSKKYWKDGEMPYQYHTGSIEDGRDEREQFVFNNVRAIWERMKQNRNDECEENAKLWYWTRIHERRLGQLTLAVGFLSILTALMILRNKR